jgi:hypothetical protein
LYEAGIIAARFVVKRKPPGDDYRPLTDAEQERELDRIEAQEKRDNVQRFAIGVHRQPLTATPCAPVSGAVRP